MKKSSLIIGVLALTLVGTLYSLPKVVVDSRNPEQTAEKAEKKPDAAAAAEESGHSGQVLTEAQLVQLASLRKSVQLAKTDTERAKLLAGLSDTFRKFQKPDSAAYYAEQRTLLQPSIENALVTGDRYYEAYGFAVDETKAAALGKKTQEWYQKVLDENPGMLAAKANMAMTYVNTPNPMQGIALLREILEADPTNELALFNLGVLSIRSNQYSKAIERFQQILTANPANSKARFYLGLCYAESGKKEEAKKAFAEVKKAEKDPVILQAIGELEQRMSESSK